MNHEQSLQEGQGLCPMSHALRLELNAAAAAMGGAPNFFSAVLNSTHAANRRGLAEDRIAVGFDSYDVTQDALLRLGYGVTLFGSGEALLRLSGMAAVTQLVRTGCAATGEIQALAADEVGTTAFVRDRRREKFTSAAAARRMARRERRGQPQQERSRTIGATDPTSTSFVQVSDHRIYLRPKGLERAPQRVAPGHVSTYGLSSPNAPLFLPISIEMTQSHSLQS